MGRVIVIMVVTVLLFAHDPASGLGWSWSTEGRDLRVTEAATCTLYVHSTPGDTLFSRPWRIVWAGTAATDTPLVCVPAESGAAIATPYAVALGPSSADSLGRVFVARFAREATNPRPTIAMYLLRIHPSLRATLALAVRNLEDQGAEWSQDDVGHLTINGGSSVPLPPLVCDVIRVDAPTGGSVAVSRPSTAAAAPAAARLSGLHLAGVRRATLVRSASAGGPASLEILSAEDTTLTVALPADLGDEQAVLLLARADEVLATAPLTSAQLGQTARTYAYGCVADSAETGNGADNAAFALNHADGSYALHYIHDSWETTSLEHRYFSRQDGTWLREGPPGWIAHPYPGSLAIGEDGVAHQFGRSAGALLHHRRGPGVGAGWTADSLGGESGVELVVATVDTTTDAIELVYGLCEYQRHRLKWTRLTESGWETPQYIETGWCDVGDYDLAVGADGRTHVAYTRQLDGAGYGEVVYAWRNAKSGPWNKEVLPAPTIMPRGVSLAFDDTGETPVVAWLDDYPWDESRRVFVQYKSSPLQEWADPEFWYSEHVPWWVQAETSPGGMTHVAFYESDGEPGPTGQNGRLFHVSRATTGYGTFRDWERDTAVVTDQAELGVGRVVPPLGMCIAGEEALITFGYVGETQAGSRICMASTAPIAAVPVLAAGEPWIQGPWPNPGHPSAEAQVMLSPRTSGPIECALCDVAGRCVRRETRALRGGQRETIHWNVSDLPVGMYFLRARSATEPILTSKWVLVR